MIDGDDSPVYLEKKGMSLDVGSVAKAYASGLALETAKEAGLTALLINAGGNIVTGEPPSDNRDRWGIGVQNPDIYGNEQSILDTVYFYNNTLSSSGGYQRFLVVNDREYHHIIDPKTLMPADNFRQVSVIHENAGLADMLSTALFILPYDEGLILAESHGLAVLWIDDQGEWFYTDAYARLSKEISGYGSIDRSIDL
jgi:thiamine biosynthesis lipoprotein